MNKASTFIWLSIIFIFLLPTSAGRFFIDMAGGIMVVIFLAAILISGVGWLSWRKIKANIKSCGNCGANYFSGSTLCPICGSNQKLDKDSSEFNIPASSATIDISAEETD